MSAGLGTAIGCLQEVVTSHRDPDSSDYLECEKAPCAWCDAAARGIAAVERQERLLEALAALEAELRQSVRSGLLFGQFDEPLDESGKRAVRVIVSRISEICQ